MPPEVATGRSQTNKPILRGEKGVRKVYLTPFRSLDA